MLGMTNYVSRFICNYAELLLPWQEVHQKALHQLKCSLPCDEVMAYL